MSSSSPITIAAEGPAAASRIAVRFSAGSGANTTPSRPCPRYRDTEITGSLRDPDAAAPTGVAPFRTSRHLATLR